MSHEICAFKVNDHRCAILTKKACMRCKFFKTPEEVAEAKKKAEARIENLPPEMKKGIMYKYHLLTENTAEIDTDMIKEV